MKSKTFQKIIEWSASIIAITGAILNALLMKEGFYLWIVSNTIFVYFAVKNKHWGLALTFFVYLIISTMGIIYW